VDRFGRADPAGFTPPPGAALASLQHANHEVGTVQPVAQVAALLHAAGVPLHTDAAMTVGRIPVDLPALGADLLTASAHKFGGPPGVGILVVRTGTRWTNPGPADEREGGRVPGFPNVPACVAAAAALHARAAEIVTEEPRLAGYVAELRRRLPAAVDDVDVLGPGDPAGRLPHVAAFSCLYVDGEALLSELDRAGIAVSSGSSCTADTLTPSHVLVAMGALSHGNIRVSFGRESGPEELETLLGVLPRAVAAVRERAGAVGL
jgi:cysteine desulfurase